MSCCDGSVDGLASRPTAVGFLDDGYQVPWIFQSRTTKIHKLHISLLDGHRRDNNDVM